MDEMNVDRMYEGMASTNEWWIDGCRHDWMNE